MKAWDNIYHKCDTYSYLDLVRKNEYGIKASIYSSKAMRKGSNGINLASTKVRMQ